MQIKKLLLPLFTGLLILTLQATARAHAAIVWAYVEDNMVHVEAFYPNGAKIQHADVLVVDENGKTLLTGKTDDEGKFSYKPVTKETQTIVVRAGESHVGDFELGEEELAQVTIDPEAK